jgi:DnaJ-class molecular chaperone
MKRLNIKFEDLWAVCSKCHGEGFVVDAPQQSAEEDKPVQAHSGPCAVCGGKGGELTDSGLAIKRLLEKIQAGD